MVMIGSVDEIRLNSCFLGYKHVFVVTDESKITKDLHYDCVCVYVNEDNKVAQIPRTG
jgi:hypothetical protein